MKIQTTTVTCPPTKHVMLHSAADQEQIVNRARRIARRTGGTIEWWDGRKEWYEVRERVDTSKSGSAQYTWHRDGNRVLCDIVQVTTAASANGKAKRQRTEFKSGTTYRKPE